MDLSYNLTSSPLALRTALADVGRGRGMYLKPLNETEAARLIVAFGASLNSPDAQATGNTPNTAAVLGPVFDILAAGAGRPPVYASGRVSNFLIYDGNWSGNNVITVLGEDAPHLDWVRVVSALDFPEATFVSILTFRFVVTIILALNNGVFPTAELLRRLWNNSRAQIWALHHAINCPPEMITFWYGALDPSRVLQPVAGITSTSPNGAWMSIDLYGILLRLSTSGIADVERSANTLLDQAAGSCPELVLLGMASSKLEDGCDVDPSGNDPNPVRARIYNALLTSAFGTLFTAPLRMAPTQPQASLLLRLWDTSRVLSAHSLLALARGVANRGGGGNEMESLRMSIEGVARVVGLTMHLPEFANVLLSAPVPQLAIECAVYFSMAGSEVEARVAAEPLPQSWVAPLGSNLSGDAHSYGTGPAVFRLELWLASHLTSSSAQGNLSPSAQQSPENRFAIACVHFIKRAVQAQSQLLVQMRAKHGAPLDGSGASNPGDRSAESIAIESANKEAIVKADIIGVIFRQLKAASSILQSATQSTTSAVLDMALKVYPSLAQSSLSHEVEEKVSSLFHEVYNESMSIPTFIDILRRYKASSESRERDSFSCIVRNLFDEYKFFPQLPDKILCISGVIFGQLINHQLVTSTTLGIALRYVLDALKKPPTPAPNGPPGALIHNKMYRFGLWALEQFKGSLAKWPQYCSHITAIQHLRAAHPAFVAEVEAILNSGSAPPTDLTTLGASTPLVPGDPLNPAASFGPETLESGGGGPSGPGGIMSHVSSHATTDSGGNAQVGGGGVSAEASLGSGMPIASGRLALSPSAIEMRAQLSALGPDLTVALAATAEGKPVPAILPSAVAAAAAAKEAEDRAAAAAGSSSSGGDSSAVHGESQRSVESPPPASAERLAFIFNNLTEINVEGKVAEAQSILRPEFYPWFASFVLKRVATQPNFQPLYRTFMERLNMKEIEREVLRAALDQAKKLLSSEKIKTSTQERSILKHLGSWLGRITLSRSRPLLFRDLNLKELLHSAYESGRLIAVVAFVAKVLEGAAESSVFRPPNPWTLGLLSCLRELYDVADLKLNLKFEVEVLAKTLGVELKDLRPSRALHQRKRPDLRNDPDFNPKAAQNLDALPGIAPNSTSRSGSGGLVGGSPAIPGLLSLVSLRSFGPLFHPSPGVDAPPGTHGEDPGADKDEPYGPKANLRNVVAVALDRAVREYIQPVVDRSVTIAVITAKELILKDFACDPDADKMSRAAHALASDLASSLAVITCAEPLRILTGTKLRELLQANPGVITSLPFSLQALGDAAVNAMLQGVVNENMEVGTLLIEKAAMDRSVRVIDEALSSAYAARREAVKMRLPFPDSSMQLGAPGSRWPAALPEILRPRDNSLRKYITWTEGASPGSDNASANMAAGNVANSQVAADGLRAPNAANVMNQAPSLALAPVVGVPLSKQVAIEEYGAVMNRLSVAVRSCAAQLGALNPPFSPANVTAATLAQLPPDHELLHALREIHSIGTRVSPGDNRQEVCMLQVGKIFKCLLELPVPPQSLLDVVATQAFFRALQLLRDLTLTLRKDLVTYLYMVPEDRRLVCDGVLIGLLRADLLHLPDFDVFLSKAGDAGRNVVGLAFTMRVVSHAIIGERLVEPKQLPNTLDFLVRVASRPSQGPQGQAIPPPPQLHLLLQRVKEVAAASEKRAQVAQAAHATNTSSLLLPMVPPSGRPLVLVGPALPVSPQSVAAAAAMAAQIVAADAYSGEYRKQVLTLLEMWVRIQNEQSADERAFAHYLSVLQESGFLSNDAQTEKFFRVLMDLCVESCAATAKPFPEDKSVPTSVLAQPNTNALAAPVPTPRFRLTYMGVDALSRLVLHLLLRIAEDKVSKMNLLQKLMGIFARVLLRDADVNGGGSTHELAAAGTPPPDSKFDARPYLRLLTNLLRELPLPPPSMGVNGVTDENAVNETSAFNAQVVATFANVLHLVQPLRVPGFAFAWLELVSHRLFLPALLSVPGLRGWPLVHRLVIDLLRFVYPYARRAELNEGLRLLNKGILRVFLVLLHDFPEFLADYAWTFLEIIPLNCLQLRNIVLLAAPPALRFIEPLDRTIPLEMLPEVGLNPRVLGSPHDSLPPKVRSEVEAYLRMRPPFSVSLQAPPHGIHPIVPHGALTAASVLRPLLLADNEEQTAMLNRWSMRTINALVPFLAIVTLSRLTEGNGVSSRVPPAATIAAAVNTGASELFRALVFDLDAEGRYALLATAVSHLRFPSAHTLFFSRLIVAVFVDATNLGGQFGDTVREQVIRVISERLLTYRPHPWGLVETFSELVRVGGGRNGVFPSFVHSSPEVERLFDGLLRMVSA